MSLSNIDLNVLVALDALLIERNVTRAAQRVSVGQPAMSASLARLRKHFDDPLLVREGRHMVLTPFAASLQAKVRAAVSTAEAALGMEKPFDPASDSATSTIIASDYATLVLLRRLLARLEAEAPHVRLDVVPIRPDFADQLRSGQADLLILPSVLITRGLGFASEELFTDRFVLVADPANTQLGASVTAEQFSRLSYVAYDHPLPSVVEEQLDAFGIVRRVQISTQSFAIIPTLISGTSFVGIIQERLAVQFAASGIVRILPLPVPLSPIQEMLYWHPRRTDDSAHRWIRTAIVAAGAGMTADTDRSS